MAVRISCRNGSLPGACQCRHDANSDQSSYPRHRTPKRNVLHAQAGQNRTVSAGNDLWKALASSPVFTIYGSRKSCAAPCPAADISCDCLWGFSPPLQSGFCQSPRSRRNPAPFLRHHCRRKAAHAFPAMLPENPYAQKANAEMAQFFAAQE